MTFSQAGVPPGGRLQLEGALRPAGLPGPGEEGHDCVRPGGGRGKSVVERGGG